MELNPSYAQAYGWNGARLMMIGKYDESLASIRRGLEIDPTADSINFSYGVCLAVSGKRDEAIHQFRKTIEMDPAFSWPTVSCRASTFGPETMPQQSRNAPKRWSSR